MISSKTHSRETNSRKRFETIAVLVVFLPTFAIPGRLIRVSGLKRGSGGAGDHQTDEFPGD